MKKERIEKRNLFNPFIARDGGSITAANQWPARRQEQRGVTRFWSG